MKSLASRFNASFRYTVGSVTRVRIKSMRSNRTEIKEPTVAFLIRGMQNLVNLQQLNSHYKSVTGSVNGQVVAEGS